MLKHIKIFEPDELSQELAKIRKQALDAVPSYKPRIVFTNGCYDILHPGHVDLLARAKLLGDILVLALNTDASVRRLGKGKERPINNLASRAFVTAHLSSVDYVTYFDEDTPYTLITKLMPNVLIKGGDWAVENIIGGDIVQNNGGLVLSLPLLEGYSTTATIQKIKANI